MDKVKKKIKQYSDFLIIGHVSPDGDTLGSGMALALGLKALGKQAAFALDGELPDKLGFVGTYGTLYRFENFPRRPYECMIGVDTGDLTRMGRFSELFSRQQHTIVIDHHMTNPGFGELNLIRPYGASGQIILELLEGMKVPIGKEIANLLYAALSTDTGNFSYTNTDASLLHAAARLREYGAEIPKLTEVIYRQRSLGATRLIGRAIDRMRLSEDGRMAQLYVLQSDYDELGAVKSDCDELINYAREIKTVEIAMFLRQVAQEKFKVSFRSKKYVDVSSLAVAFGGGGHKYAAGCTVDGNLEKVSRQIWEAAEKLL